MVYITGDTHGEVARFQYFQRIAQAKPEDFLIVAGDFGCVFGTSEDEEKLSMLEKLPFTILFLDGNHECFPKIAAYPEEVWQGGRVHRIRRNILHLLRGQVFFVDGLRIFTMGGGYSIDQEYRTPGVTWWPEEMPSEGEYDEATENLRKCGNDVDVIISHAAPDVTMQLLLQTGYLSRRFPQEQRLNSFLEYVRQTVAHKLYYFGHLHLDRPLFRNQTAIYFHIYCLNTGMRID